MLLFSAVIFPIVIIVPAAFTSFFSPLLFLSWLLNDYRSLYLIRPPQPPLSSAPSQSTKSSASLDNHLYLHTSSILLAAMLRRGCRSAVYARHGGTPNNTILSASLSSPPPLPTKEVLFEQHLHLAHCVLPSLHAQCTWDSQRHGQVVAMNCRRMMNPQHQREAWYCMIYGKIRVRECNWGNSTSSPAMLGKGGRLELTGTADKCNGREVALSVLV